MNLPAPSAWRLGVGLDGLQRAFRRFTDVEFVSDGNTAVISTIECVGWITTLVELLAPTRAHLAKLSFTSDELDLINGLRWARHQGSHRLVSTVEANLGTVYDARVPRQDWHWAWADRAELESRHALREDPRLGRAYDIALAGQQAIPTLRRAGDAVARVIGERTDSSTPGLGVV